MSAKLTASPRTLLIGAVALVLAYAALAWLLFLSPARSEAAQLGDEITAAETRLAEAQAAANQPRGAGVSVSDVLRLERAMPEGGDQVGLVLELASLARRSGVLLRSVAPQDPTEIEGGSTAVPVTVSVQGSFQEITRFLASARKLVGLDGDRIRAQGRLLGVQDIELAEAAAAGFPTLDAVITFNAFLYTGPIVQAEEGAAEEPAELQPTGSAAGAGGGS